jgi:hypothetical protein
MNLPCGFHFPDNTERKEDGKFIYCVPHRIGNMILLFGKRTSGFPYHLIIGPEWPCMLVTYSLIIVPTIFFLINVASLLGPIVISLGVFILFLTVSAFTCTACTDPGIIFEYETTIISDEETGIPSDNSNENINNNNNNNNLSNRSNSRNSSSNKKPIVCNICKVDRPLTASHCYTCNVCVDELDHHCPWTGKCIAKKNLQVFYIFIWLLCFHIIFVIATIIYSVVQGKDIFP